MAPIKPKNTTLWNYELNQMLEIEILKVDQKSKNEKNQKGIYIYYQGSQTQKEIQKRGKLTAFSRSPSST